MREADAVYGVVDMVGVVGDGDFLGLLAGAQEARHRGDLHDAADVAQRVELFVVEVAGIVAQRADAGMRRHHGGAGNLGRLQHRFLGDVRDVHDHAEAVHFGDCNAAERREAAMFLWGSLRSARGLELSANALWPLCVSVM